MFKHLRWRITLIFMALSAAICLILAAVGGFVLQAGLNRSIDEELGAIADEVESFVDLREPGPELLQWQQITRVHGRLSASIQIFNKAQHLIGAYGPPNAMPLVARQNEIIVEHSGPLFTCRMMSRPLQERGSKIAWLQICLPTHERDLAIREYIFVWALLTPALLLGLGLAGYFFAGRVTKPVEKSFAILREFLADASHELKTPVTIMQANAESLSADLSSRDLHLYEVPIILRSCTRMTTLIEDLLLLSRVEAPSISLQRERVRLNEVVQDLAEEFKQLFEEKNVRLSIDKNDPIEVSGHFDSLYRAFSNLLKNALLYTDSGGSVAVELTRNRIRQEAEIAIIDSGIGIPKESIPYIFDRFYRVDKSRSRKAGGSGLGLAIVRAIVDQHGGKVTVQSSINQGSSFKIFLPLSL